VVTRASLLALCALIAASAGAATLSKTYPVTLSQQDKTQLASAACGNTGLAGAERIVASTTKQGSNKVSAEVRCKSQASVGKFPVLHYSSCSNGTGSWRCEPGYDAIHMTLSDSAVLPVRPVGISREMAVELITEASKQIVPPFHHPALDLMRGRCSVAPHATSPSPDMKLFDIQCQGTSMLLTKHCWTGGCRYFISEGTGY
jgi:hypothetical protein